MGNATFHVGDPQAPVPNLPRRVGAVVCLIARDGAGMLMEHRSDSDLWGLIGGSLDDDESVAECACREVREETGLALAELTLLGIYSDPSRICAYPDGNVFQSIAVAFVADLPDAQLHVSAESTELRVLSWDALERVTIPATHRLIVEDARRRATSEAHCIRIQ